MRRCSYRYRTDQDRRRASNGRRMSSLIRAPQELADAIRYLICAFEWQGMARLGQCAEVDVRHIVHVALVAREGNYLVVKSPNQKRRNVDKRQPILELRILQPRIPSETCDSRTITQ